MPLGASKVQRRIETIKLMLQLEFSRHHGLSRFSSITILSPPPVAPFHIHHLWPLRGTSDGHGSNCQPAGEHVVY
jgi:hypothetical protein